MGEASIYHLRKVLSSFVINMSISSINSSFNY
ncbi:hypothetical protein LINPERHAP2_LOCUS21134 [Linum perenne]